MNQRAGWVNLGPWVDQVYLSFLISVEEEADLSCRFEQAPITLNVDTPMELVVGMFQRLGLRSILFTKRGGALGGILTKMVRNLSPNTHIDNR